MGGLGENEGPYLKQQRPFFFVFTDIFRENITSADTKTFFWFSPISSEKNGNSLGSHCLNTTLSIQFTLQQ